MKKKIILALLLITLLLTSCGAQEEVTTGIKVAALKGPTGMGLVKVMSDAKDGAVNGNEFEFTVSGSIDEVVAMISSGQTDLACVPANLGAALYNKTDGNLNVLAVNTLGVIYICENGNNINSLEDLSGKKVIASGKGATPEYCLNYILDANNINDVNIEWKSEHSECAAVLASTEDSIAMIPQPFVTTSMMQNEDITIAIDLTDEWDKVNTESTLITGIIVGNKEFIENNQQAVNAFLQSYEESVNYVNNEIEDAAKLIGEFEILPKAAAEIAIPKCNIVCITNEEMKTKLSGYLTELYNQNPAAVGGAIPEEDFYYIGK
ncbi:MAG TPA: ABC transporter substrate-binding protein [Anaerovoracaceae bacterium]|nr:ABC transporter substrate-binding protein [Anaerovoracaceae bacterium]